MASPAHWQAALPHQGKLSDLSLWWDGLSDPLLVELVQAAQTASPSVASARARLTQSRAAWTQARAALGPALDATAGLQRGLTQPATPVATTLQAGAQASWEIDLFGVNRLAAEAAQARSDSAQALWHDARVSVAAEVATRYYNQRACERQSALAQADAASRAQTAQLTERSATAGFTPPASAALARAGAAQAHGRALLQRALCALDVKALVALTGWSEPELAQRLADAPDDLAPGAALQVASVPAQALAQRPDVFSAQREVAAASADTGGAQAQRYPRLTLAGSIGAMHYDTPSFSSDLSTWSIGPLALTLPLFDGGRRAAGVQAAQARYDEAVVLYLARVRQAVREVEEALVRLQSTSERGGAADAAQAGYRAVLAATERRYQGGFANLLELEDARRLALDADSARLALRLERIQSWISLYRAVGGGWRRPEASTQPG